MLYKIIDERNNDLVRFEVLMTENMCTVAPVILDNKFNKFENRMRLIRMEALHKYCALEGNYKQEKYIKAVEKEICEKADEILTEMAKEVLNQGYKVFFIAQKEL